MKLTEKLTKAEYRVMSEIAAGFTEKEIAARNFVSKATVHAQAYSIRKKLKALGVGDVVRMFILDLEDPKKYFGAMALVAIQCFVVINDLPIEMRRGTGRNVTSQRVVKTRKRQWN